MAAQGVTGRVLTNVSMKRYSSMKVGGSVPYLFYPEDESELRAAIAWLVQKKLPFRFLGNGTNVIVSDRGFPGGLIRATGIRHCRFTVTEAGGVVEAGAGLSLKRLIRTCASRGLSGLEKLFGIPGTVGGALKMNAGSFGTAVSDCLISLTSMDETGATTKREKRELHFGYRSSSILDRECIIGAAFGLKAADPGQIKTEMDRVWSERLRKHPMELPSAGSIFKNRNGSPCWQVIDRAGLRGLRCGGACVSEKHSNFIVNTGGATASEVKRLIEIMKQRVADETGASLEEEVELWGFGDGT